MNKKSARYSPEVMERAVRMVEQSASEHDSQWAAITSIANKIGCTPETLRRWVPNSVAKFSKPTLCLMTL